MMAKLWPILFHLLVVLGPTLLGIAQHNFSSPAAEGYGVGAQFAGKHLMLGAGIASLAGAVVAAHKWTSQKSAQLPPLSAPTSTSDRSKLCDLLWANVGVNATTDQIKAIQDLKKT